MQLGKINELKVVLNSMNRIPTHLECYRSRYHPFCCFYSLYKKPPPKKKVNCLKRKWQKLTFRLRAIVQNKMDRMRYRLNNFFSTDLSIEPVYYYYPNPWYRHVCKKSEKRHKNHPVVSVEDYCSRDVPKYLKNSYDCTITITDKKKNVVKKYEITMPQLKVKKSKVHDKKVETMPIDLKPIIDDRVKLRNSYKYSSTQESKVFVRKEYTVKKVPKIDKIPEVKKSEDLKHPPIKEISFPKNKIEKMSSLESDTITMNSVNESSKWVDHLWDKCMTMLKPEKMDNEDDQETMQVSFEFKTDTCQDLSRQDTLHDLSRHDTLQDLSKQDFSELENAFVNIETQTEYNVKDSFCQNSDFNEVEDKSCGFCLKLRSVETQCCVDVKNSFCQNCTETIEKSSECDFEKVSTGIQCLNSSKDFDCQNCTETEEKSCGFCLKMSSVETQSCVNVQNSFCQSCAETVDTGTGSVCPQFVDFCGQSRSETLEIGCSAKTATNDSETQCNKAVALAESQTYPNRKNPKVIYKRIKKKKKPKKTLKIKHEVAEVKKKKQRSLFTSLENDVRQSFTLGCGAGPWGDAEAQINETEKAIIHELIQDAKLWIQKRQKSTLNENIEVILKAIQTLRRPKHNY